MELKIFLSVLLVLVPVVFHSNCANASPANRVPTDHVPEQLAALTGHHSNKKTASLITDKRPVFRTVDPRSQQFTAVSYFGQIHEQNQNFAFILNVTYTDGWLVYDIFGVTYWQGGQGYVIVSDGGLDQNYWTVTWYLPANVSATFSIQVNIYREVSKVYTIR
jgi:hypothetical protein